MLLDAILKYAPLFMPIITLIFGVIITVRIEHYKTKEQKRQKAILIAELIAERSSFPKDVKRLNQLSYEACLLLPKEIILQLSPILMNKKDAISSLQILVEVRNYIWNDKHEIISPDSIIWFKNPEEK